MLNNIKIIANAMWDAFAEFCGFLSKIIYFPWNVVFKLWHWVYDED